MKLSECTVAIVGMGLMGGSLGRALVSTRACKEVRGFTRNPQNGESIVSLQAADRVYTDLSELFAGARLTVLATPVRTIEQQIATLHPFMDSGTVLTDMGSVKRNVVEAMRKLPPEIKPIAGHPMCGKETAGIQASDPELFRNKKWVVVPTENSDPRAVRLLEELIETVGARAVVMDAETHDLAAACVSHLAYVLAASLVSSTDRTARTVPEVWLLASSGFRDTSRVAAGNIDMIMDILSANKDNVLAMIETATEQLGDFARLLTTGDDAELREKLTHIRMTRRSCDTNQLF